jgi:hypothetical protein
MDITNILELLPETVKLDIIDFQPVKLKTGENATRVLLDRILTDNEKSKMQNARIVGLDCIAAHRYAPEIKKSYFYMLEA